MSAYTFTTITADDWRRAFERARAVGRAEGNAIARQIREKFHREQTQNAPLGVAGTPTSWKGRESGGEERPIRICRPR